MAQADKELDTTAVPVPERYTLTGRLCRPYSERYGPRPETHLLWSQAVLVDRQIMGFLAAIARSHGFPLMRLTVEILSTPGQAGDRDARAAELCPRCGSLWWPAEEGLYKCPNCGHTGREDACGSGPKAVR